MSSIWNGLLDFLGGTLALLYDLVPNLGVAIILLTLVVSLALFPLTLKQTRSMRAMSEIQPQVKALQAKYKDDRDKLYAELQQLYKEKGVNPAAGCLPLILQMPIWFALFRVLRDPEDFVKPDTSLGEALQGGDTDFLGLDLLLQPSEVVGDGFVALLPYIILILVVVGTGYYQQYQTTARTQKDGQPQAAQQMQTVMKIFPLVFGFISWQLPAGLVLYFAVSQVFRIGQQALIIKIDGHPGAAKAAEPAAEKAPPEEAPAPEAEGAARPRQSRRRKKKRRK